VTAEGVILSSFETDFRQEGEGRPPDRYLAGRGQGQAFTPALILFIVLSETEDKTDPG
jgi:hypothetical protein